MLAESDVDGEIVAGYGDSASDVAMLDLASTAVLVNLSAPAAENIRRQLTGPNRVIYTHWPPRRNDTKDIRS